MCVNKPFSLNHWIEASVLSILLPTSSEGKSEDRYSSKGGYKFSQRRAPRPVCHFRSVINRVSWASMKWLGSLIQRAKQSFVGSHGVIRVSELMVSLKNPFISSAFKATQRLYFCNNMGPAIQEAPHVRLLAPNHNQIQVIRNINSAYVKFSNTE